MDEQHQQIILDDKFMGTKEPMWYLPKEQPWHRKAAWALAQGHSLKEVANLLDRSEPAVQNLTRQQWFQAEVTTIMAECGRDEMALIRAEAFNSVNTLRDLRDNPKVPAAVRFASAKDILDRTLGKPVQRVETTQVTSTRGPSPEVDRLEQENNRMRRDSELGLQAPR